MVSVIFRAPCSRRVSLTSEKRNAISSEAAWRACKLSGRSTPGNLPAKRPTSRNQGGICLERELQRVVERASHSSDSKSLQAMCRSFAGTKFQRQNSRRYFPSSPPVGSGFSGATIRLPRYEVLDRGRAHAVPGGFPVENESGAATRSRPRPIIVPRTISGYGPSAGKQVKYRCLDFEGLADIEPKLVTPRPPFRKQTERSKGLRVLFSRRHRQPAASPAVDGGARVVSSDVIGRRSRAINQIPRS